MARNLRRHLRRMLNVPGDILGCRVLFFDGRRNGRSDLRDPIDEISDPGNRVDSRLAVEVHGSELDAAASSLPPRQAAA